MLRRALGPASLASRDGGYALEVDADHVDVLAVQQVAATAARLREGARARAGGRPVRLALRLFRGTPLLVAGDAEWASVPRTRVDEAHTTLLEIRFWARLELGGAAGVIGELEGAVADHPFQEALWELLITALYRVGRQADALAAYQRVRNHLADELGLDPGPQLQQLEREILAQDAAVGVSLTARPTPGSGTSAGQPARRCRPDWSVATHDLATRGRAAVARIGWSRSSVRVGSARPRSRSTSAGGCRHRTRGRRLVWLARLETAVHPSGRGRRRSSPRWTARVRPRSSSGSRASSAPRDPRQLRARRWTRSRTSRCGCSTSPRRCGSCAPVRCPLDIDGERVVELAPLALDDAVELFARRAIARLSRHRWRDHERVLDLCRVPRRSAARDRARRRTDPDPDRRGDQPSARRPVQLS